MRTRIQISNTHEKHPVQVGMGDGGGSGGGTGWGWDWGVAYSAAWWRQKDSQELTAQSTAEIWVQ